MVKLGVIRCLLDNMEIIFFLENWFLYIRRAAASSEQQPLARCSRRELLARRAREHKGYCSLLAGRVREQLARAGYPTLVSAQFFYFLKKIVSFWVENFWVLSKKVDKMLIFEENGQIFCFLLFFFIFAIFFILRKIRKKILF